MDVLRATEVKAFSVSLVCFLIFLLPAVPGPAAFLLFLTANTALLVGFFCSFDRVIPLSALAAIGFLAAAATVVLWVGALALRNPPAAWPLFVLSGAYPAAALLPDLPAEVVAMATMFFGFIGIGAAVAMTQRRKIGYWIWSALIVILLASDLWVLKTGLVSIGSSPAKDDAFGPFGWWPLLLPVLYALAYGRRLKASN